MTEELSTGPAEAMAPNSEPAPSTPENSMPEPQPRSTREVVEAAFEKVVDEPEEEEVFHVEEAAKPAGGKERDEQGRFVKKTEEPAEAAETAPADQDGEQKEKPQAAVEAAPEWLPPEAKASWKDTPEPARKAIADATAVVQRIQEQVAPLREHLEFARSVGKSLPDLVQGWRTYEQNFSQKPAETIIHIARAMKMDPADLAMSILDKSGEKPQEQPGPSPEAIALQRENAELKRQLQQSQQTEAQRSSSQIVSDFRAQNPDYDALETEIAEELMYMQRTSNPAADLARAYKVVKSRQPAAAPSPEPGPAPKPRAANQQVTGAPSRGVNTPAKVSLSGRTTQERLASAFDQLGI